MNLEVRLLARPDGTAEFVLCDENGAMLPLQAGVDIYQMPDDAPEIVVRFVVDGERVRFTNLLAADPAPPPVAVPEGSSGSTVVPMKRGRKPH